MANSTCLNLIKKNSLLAWDIFVSAAFVFVLCFFFERRYTRAEIEQKVSTAGFALLRSSSFVTSLLPAIILSRVFQMRKTKHFDPAGELKINTALNKLFYGFMMLELAGIIAGMDYPVGGSRFVIAERNQ